MSKVEIIPVNTPTCSPPLFDYEPIRIEDIKEGDYFNWRNPHRGVNEDYWTEVRAPIVEKIKQGGEIFIVVRKKN
jgi:hypothetical protein